MFKKILVPLDLSDKHRAALRIAEELARQSGGETILLHVIEVIPGLDMDEEKDFYRKLEQAAQKHLKKAADGFTHSKIPCQEEIRYGPRAAEIAHFAREKQADLIVLSAPQHDPAHPAAGLGSLSYKIGFLASCPVLLVK